MAKHEDNDPVMYGYASSHNISFKGSDELGYTWGEWREMSIEYQDEVIREKANELVDVWIVDDED